MNSDKTGWRVLHTHSDTFAPVTYWAHDFDDAIKTISIIASKGRKNDYAVQRKADGKWVEVPHSL